MNKLEYSIAAFLCSCAITCCLILGILAVNALLGI